MTILDGDTEHAALYHTMEHTPHHPVVAASYQSLTDGLIHQYNTLIADGYRFVFGDYDYPSSADMFDALDAERVLHVLSTESASAGMLSDHPFHAVVTVHTPDSTESLRINDVFRAVHDIYGHYFRRNSFGEQGEFAAWVDHLLTLPNDAYIALFCETRGQSAWLNFHADHQEYPMRDRPFPVGKAGLVDHDEVLRLVADRFTDVAVR